MKPRLSLRSSLVGIALIAVLLSVFVRNQRRVHTLGVDEFRRIDDFVNYKVRITAEYSSDGAGNGLLVHHFIDVDFAGDRSEPPNGHEVTVIGRLKRRGAGKTAFYLIDNARWEYPPGAS